MADEAKVLEPVEPSRRIAVLDALRGFALFGVLVANTQHFAGTTGAPPVSDSLHWPTLDRAARFVIDAGVDGKFYSLFSILFGVGFAIQWERWPEPLRTSRRRLAVLLGFGLLHLCLLWFGDILAFYALTGFVLLWFRHHSTAKLVRMSVLLFAIPVVMHAVFLLCMPPSVGVDPSEARFAMERGVAEGGYLGRIHWNVTHGLAQRGFDLFASGRPFKVLATFMLGICAWRMDFFRVDASRLASLQRVFKLGLLLGIPLNIALASMMQTSAYERLQPLGLLQPVFYAYGVPALALAYAAGFVLLFRNETFAKVASSTLGRVGRLSLSNYVLQSVIGILIYDRFAGGWFARFGTSVSLLVACGIFTLQIALSVIWLRSFRQGPLEWAWRALTYGKRTPLVVEPSASAPGKLSEGWARR
jgi:uncharacterized protein